MSDILELLERPQAQRTVMIVGWRQWADAGAVSSALPLYLIQQTNARHIGLIHPDGFYLFQIPGTHDLVRPVVHFNQGYPEELELPQNEFYYTGNSERGVVIFLGHEPHLQVERYTATLLQAAKELGVQRIVGLGGVYGELPYNKERTVSCNYSLRRLKKELSRLAVNLSDYHGGASIGSYLCRRAGDRNMEYVGLYAFVPTYDFSSLEEIGSGIRLEHDFMAWLGVMRRVNYLLKTDFDLTDLEHKSRHLIQVMDAKVEELDRAAPQAGVREYFARLADSFAEEIFNPLDDVWEDEIRRILDDEAGTGEA